MNALSIIMPLFAAPAQEVLTTRTALEFSKQCYEIVSAYHGKDIQALVDEEKTAVSYNVMNRCFLTGKITKHEVQTVLAESIARLLCGAPHEINPINQPLPNLTASDMLNIVYWKSVPQSLSWICGYLVVDYAVALTELVAKGEPLTSEAIYQKIRELHAQHKKEILTIKNTIRQDPASGIEPRINASITCLTRLYEDELFRQREGNRILPEPEKEAEDDHLRDLADIFKISNFFVLGFNPQRNGAPAFSVSQAAIFEAYKDLVKCDPKSLPNWIISYKNKYRKESAEEKSKREDNLQHLLVCTSVNDIQEWIIKYYDQQDVQAHITLRIHNMIRALYLDKGAVQTVHFACALRSPALHWILVSVIKRKNMNPFIHIADSYNYDITPESEAGRLIAFIEHTFLKPFTETHQKD